MELHHRFNLMFLVFVVALRSVLGCLCVSLSCFPVYSWPRPLSYAYARKVEALPVSVDQALDAASLGRDSDFQCELSLRWLFSAVISLAISSLIMFSSTISSLVERFCAALPRRRLRAAHHAGVVLCSLGSDSVVSSSSSMGVASEASRHAGVYGAVIPGFLSLFAATKPPVPVPLCTGPCPAVDQTVNTSIFSAPFLVPPFLRPTVIASVCRARAQCRWQNDT